MKEYSQKEKIIYDIRKIIHNDEVLQYLRDNVPYELLQDKEFIERLIKTNPRVRETLELAKLYKEEEQITSAGPSESIEDFAQSIEGVSLDVAIAKYRDKVFELAQYYEEQGDYEKAQHYYSAIISNGRNRVEKFMQKNEYDDKDTVYHRAVIRELACKAAMGNELTEEENKLLDSSLETVTANENSKEAFLAYFSLIPQEQLLTGNFEDALRGGIRTRTRRKDSPVRPGGGGTPKEYSEELHPTKRIKFIVENYNVTKAYTGIGQFAGHIVFEIEDKNVFVVEKFYENFMYEGDNEPTPSVGSATYILSRDIDDLDIGALNKGQLVSMRKSGVKGIDKRNHTSENPQGYYERVAESIETIGKNISIEEVEETQPTKKTGRKKKQKEEAEKEDKKGTIIPDIETDETKIRAPEEILDEMQQLDEEYRMLKKRLEEIRDSAHTRSEDIKIKAEQIRTEMRDGTAKSMTEELKGIILEQFETLKKLRAELSELEQIENSIEVQEIEQQIEKNRAKREKLNEELMGIIGE